MEWFINSRLIPYQLAGGHPTSTQSAFILQFLAFVTPHPNPLSYWSAVAQPGVLSIGTCAMMAFQMTFSSVLMEAWHVTSTDHCS